MRRFYCKQENIKQDSIFIKEKSEIHHIKNVLRLKIGDKISVFSDNNIDYEGVIFEITPQALSIKIKHAKSRVSNPGIEVILACAIPKKAKIEYIIEKATELGVTNFIPLKTQRTIVDLRGREASRLLRWRKIAKSSAKQCGRTNVLRISNVLTFRQAIKHVEDCDLAIIPNISLQKIHIRDLIVDTKFKRVLIFIGPEGDFTQEEIDLAIKNGCTPVSLGENILRVDTAAIITCGLFILGARH